MNVMIVDIKLLYDPISSTSSRGTSYPVLPDSSLRMLLERLLLGCNGGGISLNIVTSELA